MRVLPFCAGIIHLFVALVLVWAVTPIPQTALAAAKGGSTRIVSQKMTYDADKKRIIFEGKVHVTQSDMELWADRLTMSMSSDSKPTAKESTAALGMQGGKVERIVAEKNVRIKQENKTGTCGRATYFVKEGKILMEQNPVIIDGVNHIRGRSITFYTDSGRSEVTGNVDVRFTTEEGNTNQFMAPQTNSAKPIGRSRAAQ